jgi:hypothetical protein
MIINIANPDFPLSKIFDLWPQTLKKNYDLPWGLFLMSSTVTLDNLEKWENTFSVNFYE